MIDLFQPAPRPQPTFDDLMSRWAGRELDPQAALARFRAHRVRREQAAAERAVQGDA
jgi:hypothetical protein